MRTRTSADKVAADAREVRDESASMPEGGREPAEWVRTLVRTAASDPAPELWYGQPAYARKGKVVCYFRSGRMDEERYPTFGFSAQACLDNDSGLWPTAFAWTEPSCRWAPV